MAKYVVTIEAPGSELSVDEIEARLVAAIPKADVKKFDSIHVSVSLTKPPKTHFNWGAIGEAQPHHQPLDKFFLPPEQVAQWDGDEADGEDVAFEDDPEDPMLVFEDDDEGFEGENATALDDTALIPEPNYEDGQNNALDKMWWAKYQ